MDISQKFPHSLQNKQIFTEFDNSFERCETVFSMFVIVTPAIDMTHWKIKTASLTVSLLGSWCAVLRKLNPDLEHVLISVNILPWPMPGYQLDITKCKAEKEHMEASFHPWEMRCKRRLSSLSVIPRITENGC